MLNETCLQPIAHCLVRRHEQKWKLLSDQNLMPVERFFLSERSEQRCQGSVRELGLVGCRDDKALYRVSLVLLQTRLLLYARNN